MPCRKQFFFLRCLPPPPEKARVRQGSCSLRGTARRTVRTCRKGLGRSALAHWEFHALQPLSLNYGEPSRALGKKELGQGSSQRCCGGIFQDEKNRRISMRFRARGGGGGRLSALRPGRVKFVLLKFSVFHTVFLT